MGAGDGRDLIIKLDLTHLDPRSDHLSEGYTMTREDGWFDFMLNGGGAVTLQFGKSPFPPKIETLFAPWNEVN